MMHKFDTKQKEKLDNPKRREALPPFETLKKLGLKEGERFADIGCGIGYFTLPASQIMGKDGRVFAVDLSEDMLLETEKAAKENNITNIEFKKSDEYGLKLENNLVTYCFICNVLHEIEDLPRFIKEIRRIIAEGGKLVVIEWAKKVGTWGPPVEHRIASEDMIALLEEQHFSLENQISIGDDFYVVVCKKEAAVNV